LCDAIDGDFAIDDERNASNHEAVPCRFDEPLSWRFIFVEEESSMPSQLKLAFSH
jgi:hypothetical protein